MKLFKHSALTAVLLVLSGTSYAVDTLNVKQLQRLCADPSSDEACSFYLRGFLDGAIATAMPVRVPDLLEPGTRGHKTR
jgi:hypothetical protein